MMQEIYDYAYELFMNSWNYFSMNHWIVLKSYPRINQFGLHASHAYY